MRRSAALRPLWPGRRSLQLLAGSLLMACSSSAENPLQPHPVSFESIRQFAGERARFIRYENGVAVVGTSAALYVGLRFDQLQQHTYPEEVPTFFTGVPDSTGTVVGLAPPARIFFFSSVGWTEATPNLPDHPDGAPNFLYDAEWAGSSVLVAGNHGVVLLGNEHGWQDVSVDRVVNFYEIERIADQFIVAGEGIFRTSRLDPPAWTMDDSLCAPRKGLIASLQSARSETWYADVQFGNGIDITAIVRTNPSCEAAIVMESYGRVGRSFSEAETIGFVFRDGRIWIGTGAGYQVLQLPVRPVGASLESFRLWVLYQAPEGATLARVPSN